MASRPPLDLLALRMFGQVLPGILLQTDSQMGWRSLQPSEPHGCLGECMLRQVLLGPAPHFLLLKAPCAHSSKCYRDARPPGSQLLPSVRFGAQAPSRDHGLCV